MKEKSSTPRSFRVPISVPLLSKVNAVAEFKRRQRAREATLSVSSACSSAIEPNRPYLTLTEGTPEYEDGQAKLEQLYLRGQELRAELHSLNSVRSSLLWLLTKVNALELKNNHSGPVMPD